MKATGNRSLSSFLVGLLNVLWYGLALVLVLTMCFMVAGSPVAVQILPEGVNVTQGANVKMAIPVSFSVDARSLRVTSPSLGVEDAQVQDARGSLRFAPPAGAWLATGVVILLLALALWVIAQLRALFRTVRDGQPFVPANAMRVRRIAYAVILGELARSAVVFWGNHYAMIHFSADGLRFDARPHINAFAIIDGLIILAIAEVFRAGTRLDEEQSLTV